MADVKAIPSSQAPHVWGDVSRFLEPALERDGSYTDEDLLTLVQTRQMQLWLIPDRAAAVTQIQTFPRKKVLAVLYLGGNRMEEWLDDLQDALEEYGRGMGCDYIESQGRRGWEKVCKPRGGEFVCSIMRKRL